MKIDEARCLKFVGYIYLPKTNSKAKDLKYYATRFGAGRLQIFDEHLRRPNRAIACNLGGMMKLVADEYCKRASKRLK